MKFRPIRATDEVAELLPEPCRMKLIKGRRVRRTTTTPRDEEKFRFPPTEEIWEVACVEDRDCEEREVQTAVRKRRDFPMAS